LRGEAGDDEMVRLGGGGERRLLTRLLLVASPPPYDASKEQCVSACIALTTPAPAPRAAPAP
jgi:hypothetical protein